MHTGAEDHTLSIRSVFLCLGVTCLSTAVGQHLVQINDRMIDAMTVQGVITHPSSYKHTGMNEWP